MITNAYNCIWGAYRFKVKRNIFIVCVFFLTIVLNSMVYFKCKNIYSNELGFVFTNKL